MILEVGKRYETRGGLTAKVVARDETGRGTPREFIVLLTHRGEPFTLRYCADGQFYGDDEGSYDIMRECQSATPPPSGVDIYKTTRVNLQLPNGTYLAFEGTQKHGDLIIRGERTTDTFTVCDFDLTEADLNAIIEALNIFKQDYFSGD